MRSTVHAVTPNEMFHDTLKQLIAFNAAITFANAVCKQHTGPN
jgi:hypothetical protein